MSNSLVIMDIICTVIYGMHLLENTLWVKGCHLITFIDTLLLYWKNGIVIRHPPKKFSRICSLFLARGDAISCIITGEQKYSHDLTQAGLELPCKLLFTGKSKGINKLKWFFTHKKREWFRCKNGNYKTNEWFRWKLLFVQCSTLILLTVVHLN